MSGPVTTQDAAPDQPDCGHPARPEVEVTASRDAEVGGVPVRRALPRRTRRTVGGWCFADHFGPVAVDPDAPGMEIGPHPHTGLHTVTWLVSGELLHHDSIGSEQLVRPGQLNLMTAGHGVAHAEETPAATAAHGVVQHGIQLWVAQPEATRHGAAAFEHHGDLPTVGLAGGRATVLVGGLAGADAVSPARHDTPLIGAELTLAAASTLPLDPDFEHALVVLEGALAVEGAAVAPGTLAYLGRGRDGVVVAPAGDGARALLLGGAPFPEDIVMGWNFVARSREEIDRAAADWNAGSARFGDVDSGLPRIPAP
jgi:redox-sensitive bicupin YhaK (pirin superfamily)